MPATLSRPPILGSTLPGFRLPEPLTGRLVSPEDYPFATAVLVVFLSNACPEATRLAPALSKLGLEYEARGVQAFAVNAFDDGERPQEAPAEVAAEALRRGYVFPYLIDQTRQAARALGALRAPDFYLFDAERRLFYHGQFDETRFGDQRAPHGRDLRRAIEATLAGEPPPERQVATSGCLIR
jgi:hypothetical protein